MSYPHPSSLSTSLDSAIKHALFRDHVSRSGVSWDRLAAGSGPLAELCEIDTRFGELGSRGLFHSFDRAEVLDHRLPELGSVEEAMSSAPAGGRAEVRGRVIRELQADRQRYQCQWERVWDEEEGRMYDMGDPYGRSPQWRDLEVRTQRGSREEVRRLRVTSHLNRGISLYQAEHLSEASEVLGSVAVSARTLGDLDAEARARFWSATAYHDLGALQAGEDVLTPILETVDQDASRATACRVGSRYALILIERPAERARIEEAAERARACFEGSDSEAGRSRVSMVEARLQGVLGHYDEAIEIMDRAVQEERSDAVSFARTSYLRWFVSFLLRSGQHARADVYMNLWRGIIARGASHQHGDVTLACAESMIARCQGRHRDALDHARVALTRANSSERDRYRVYACCALIESAVEAGEYEVARPYVEELSTWHDIEIGEQRCDIYSAAAAFYRAASEQPALPGVGRGVEVGAGAGESWGWGGANAGSSGAADEPAVVLECRHTLAEEAALAEARSMDERLGTTHHVGEVGEGGRPVG